MAKSGRPSLSESDLYFEVNTLFKIRSDNEKREWA
jgi:hypothetical protein